MNWKPNIKWNLSAKLLLYILSTSFIIFTLAIGIITLNFRNMAWEDAKVISEVYAEKYAKEAEATFTSYLSSVRTLKHVFETYPNVPEGERRNVFQNMMKKTLEEEKDFVSVWSTWEPYSIDNLDSLYVNKQGSSIIGNFGYLYYRENKSVHIDTSIPTDATKIYSGEHYTKPKTVGHEVILDPYFYSYSGKTAKILETTISAPIMVNKNFKGIIGVDVPLARFQEIASDIKPMKTGYAFFMSNNGMFVAHPQTDLIGTLISKEDENSTTKYSIVGNIKRGKKFSFIRKSSIVGEAYTTFAPIHIGNTQTPWSIVIVIPVKTIMETANQNFFISLFIGIIGLITLTIVVWFIAKKITTPLNDISFILKNLAHGDINVDKKLEINSEDEISETRKSLNTLIDGLLNTAQFANEIGKGNLNAEFKMSSEKDVFGKALLEMKNSLLKAEEENKKRKEEEEKNQWTTNGIAKFGDILRINNQDITDFCYVVISELIDYLEANQGGVFITDTKKSELNLMASYAYSRRKYLEKKIKYGIGIIGQAALEKETIYMKNVPSDYIEITSGLGKATPSAVLIIPVINNESLMAIIEIASFKKFKKYQIEFIEKIAESLALSLSGVKTNIATQKLLEDSNRKSEELASHEEQLKQNMEEMQTTQDQLQKEIEQNKEIENILQDQQEKLKGNLVFMEKVLDAIQHPMFYKNKDGVYLGCNQAFAEFIELSKEEIINHTTYDIAPPELAAKYHSSDMELISKGGNQQYKSQVQNASGEIYDTIFSKSVYFNEKGEIDGLVGLIIKS